MQDWIAYYVNNPYDDYNIVCEIEYKENDVAVIYKGEHGLDLKWYASSEDLVVPLEWLTNLLLDASKSLG